MYDFMKNEAVEQLTTAVEYVDYFMILKQEMLGKVDALNWSIMNCVNRVEDMKADILLNTDFKELYGKDNESIRKAHIHKETSELITQLNNYKFQKSAIMNQIDAVNDIIKANQILLAEHQCNCNHGDEHDGSYI